MSSRRTRMVGVEMDREACRDIRKGLRMRVVLQKFGVDEELFPFDGSMNLMGWMGILHMVVNEGFVRPAYQLLVIDEIYVTILELAELDDAGRHTLRLLFGQMREFILLSPVLMPGTGMEDMTREEVIKLKRKLLVNAMRKLMDALGLSA